MPENSERGGVEVIFSSSFDDHITNPTRVRENTANLIDNIWSNSKERLSPGA